MKSPLVFTALLAVFLTACGKPGAPTPETPVPPTATPAPVPAASSPEPAALAPVAPPHVAPAPPATRPAPGPVQPVAPAVPAAPAPGPATPAPAADLALGQQTYRQACAFCHDKGVAGAPKLGDASAWAPRLAQGLDALYASSLRGKGAMPAKGGNPALADDAVKAAVDYLVAQAH